jgi:hypothetical protein
MTLTQRQLRTAILNICKERKRAAITMVDNVEEAWRENLLANFNYAAAVEVTIGNTEAA